MSPGPTDLLDSRLVERVRRLRAGEPGAADALDALLRPRLLGYFALGPWPRDEAQDLVQKALVLVFTSVGQLRDEASFIPWLFAIARNVRSTAMRSWSMRGRWEAGGLDLAGDPPAPDDRARREDAQEQARRIAALRAALEQLPSRQRQCLLLRVRDELSYEEIAEVFQLSVHTVRNHIAQAKESLRRRFGTALGETVE
jgi:RNA polymerase sigma-70 factor (ECF subfamily)